VVTGIVLYALVVVVPSLLLYLFAAVLVAFVILAIVTWVVTIIAAFTLRFHKGPLLATEKLAQSPLLDRDQVGDHA